MTGTAQDQGGHDSLRVLLVTGGHPFAKEPFLDAWAADPGLAVTHVEHPGAAEWIADGRAAQFDAIVFYDMPGVGFSVGELPSTPAAPPGVIAGFSTLTEAGTGLVFLHHALASWPGWAGFAEIVGGRFHYTPARLRDTQWPDSGYLLDVEHQIEVVDPSHAVCAGVPPRFSVVDELYLAPVFELEVTPLLRSDFVFTDTAFWSASRAVAGHRDDRTGWRHPDGSNLVGWSRVVGSSRVVYLQPGDGPLAYAHPAVRRLWGNAVRWVADQPVADHASA